MGKHEIKIPLDDETAKYLTTALNELYDRLDKMSYDELKAWYEENLTLPSYTTEIDGNLITVQSHFNGHANETILEKIVRLLGLKIKYE
jgi:aconitase A